MGDILRVTEGNLAPVNCLETEENLCPRAEGCKSLQFWKGFYDTINKYLDSATLLDLADVKWNDVDAGKFI